MTNRSERVTFKSEAPPDWLQEAACRKAVTANAHSRQRPRDVTDQVH